MKMKKPSLKGMKNTKYLGHFAKDEYIQKGHNFSGRMNLMPYQPSQIEMMGPANPFDVAAELQRRKDQVEKEADFYGSKAARQQERADSGMSSDERWVRQLDTSGNVDAYLDQRKRERRDAAYSRKAESVRSRRKKFMTEI